MLLEASDLHERAVVVDARTIRRRVAARAAERAALPPLAARTHMYVRSLAYEVDTTPSASGTHVLLYGSTATGETVAARVTGFDPHFYVRVPSDDVVPHFVEQLNAALVIGTLRRSSSVRWALRRLVASGRVRPVASYTLVSRATLKASGDDRGYNGGRSDRFARIVVYAPEYVRMARDVLEAVYEARARPCTSARDFIALAFVEQRRFANADDEPPLPATKRLKPSEQRLVDAAADTTPLTECVPARQRINDAANDDDDSNPWLDPLVDVVFDDNVDNDVPSLSTLSVHDDDDVASAFASMVTRSHSPSIHRSLRLVDDAPVDVFEADIDFVLRFMIAANFKAEQCIVFDDDVSVLRRESHATVNDVQLTCDWTQLRRLSDERYQKSVPPQICLSFDCEMELGADGSFPRPETERVLQICAVVFDPIVDAACKHVVRRTFVLGSIELPSAEEQAERQAFTFAADEVYAFHSEPALLIAFSAFVRALQPDVLTGYNIEGFDVSYVLERAEVLGIHDQMASLTRSAHGLVRTVERSFSSAAHGTHLFKEVLGDGLFVLDLFPALKRSTYKLRSYSLEFVSKRFLGDRKDDVAYSAINGMQQHADGRYKLMHYCTKDALLPARLMGKFNMLLNTIGMARLTGAPVDMIIRRGLQIRLTSFLYHKSAARAALFYTRTNADRAASEGLSFEGAHVEEPVRGYHDEVVVTLDFNSLYPSIIITLNMCYLTFIRAGGLLDAKARYSLTDDDVWTCVRDALPGVDQPSFVRSSRQQGLVPEVLKELLAERAAIRARMPACADDFERSLLDSEQNNMKLLANSLFGFTGAASSRAYAVEIAASTTAIGRMVIRETKALVEREFTRARGYPFDARVIYGDTDSVFVKLVNREARVSVVDSATWGKRMAAFVTAHFRTVFGDRPDNVMKIVYEKSFSKLLMYEKKRYAGILWELKTKGGVERLERRDEPKASGMETERRDSCLLVSDAVGRVLALLLDDNASRAVALERVRTYLANDVLGRLDAGAVPWNELIQSKQYRKRPAEYTATGSKPPIHVRVAAELERRRAAGATGVVYRPGDRIQFVVLESTDDGEDPEYAWKAGLRLSATYYARNGVAQTMVRVLEPVFDVAPASDTLWAFSSTAAPSSSSTAPRRVESARVTMRRFDDFMAGAVRTNQRASHVPLASALVGTTIVRCRLCSAPTSDCRRHTPAEVAARDADDARQRAAIGSEHDRLGRVCRACTQGWDADKHAARAALLPPLDATSDIEDAVGCQNTTCDVYWRRRLVDRQRRLLPL